MVSINYQCMKAFRLMPHLSKMPLKNYQRPFSAIPLTRSLYIQIQNYSKAAERREHFQSSTTKLLLSKYRESCDLCNGARQYSTKTEKFTLKNDTYREYLNSLEVECKELSSAQMIGERLGKDKSQRLLILKRFVGIFEELKVKYNELEELELMQNDEEMKEIAKEEKQICCKEIEELEERLVDLICPVEQADECDIILEVESGAGGQEAMLFVQEVFEMYQNYAQHRGWQFDVTQVTNADEGVRKVSAAIKGQGVFGELKYEGGIHRVQRIPKTESKGRIHTSTISVAILPQPTEIDVAIKASDLHITSMRSSGPGGQNVNKVNTAVRIKHLPTGIVAECQVSRSQVKNKEMAFVILRSRIYEREYQKQMSKTISQRKIQVGNKDRSEKIRTYNFAQDRITDHRLGRNFYNMAEFMTGGDGLEKMITELHEEANLENLNILLEEFEQTHMKKKDRS